MHYNLQIFCNKISVELRNGACYILQKKNKHVLPLEEKLKKYKAWWKILEIWNKSTVYKLWAAVEFFSSRKHLMLQSLPSPSLPSSVKYVKTDKSKETPKLVLSKYFRLVITPYVEQKWMWFVNFIHTCTYSHVVYVLVLNILC